MGSDVVAAVEVMAHREKQTLLRGAAPIFEWRPGVPIDDNDEHHDDN